MGHPPILVIDDEPDIRKLLSRTLEENGYRCAEAGNAEEALAKLGEGDYELVVLDINMPGMTGIDLLPLMKERYPETAVIMATATVDTGVAIQCMKNGAYDYITKPFYLDEVVISVSRALEKRRLEMENRDYQLNLETKVKEQADKIRTSFLSAVTALVYALEARDEYTSGHSQRVSKMAVSIAREMGMPPDSIEKIRLAGLIHDIGKIGVREDILRKEDKLSEEEYRHIMAHCEIGERILSPIVEDEEILAMVKYHHKLDGVRPVSRGTAILVLADAFDAMTSDRPYRKALPIKEALDEVSHGINKQFDPQVVAAFFRVVGEGYYVKWKIK